jgi:hypothetical protein
MARRGIALLAACVLGAALAAAAGAGADPATAAKPAPNLDGWYPPADPESASVRLGRRTAAAVDLPLCGGTLSLEALGRAVLAAVAAGDAGAMLGWCVTRQEFEVILWPEFPESRPATGLLAVDGWRVLANRLTSGSHGAVSDHGGQPWTFVRLEATAGVRAYRNFRLHRGLVLVAKDAAGEERRLDFLRTAVERGGRFKIYSLRD